MNKQLCFTVLLILSVLLSVSIVCASDISVTDSYATSLVDDTNDVSISNGNAAGSSEILASSVSNVDNDSSKVSLSSEEVLESDNSNTLSTNTKSNSAESITYVDSDSVISESVSNDLTNNENAKLTASNAANNVATKLTSANVNVNYKSNGCLVATLKDVNGNAINGVRVKIVVGSLTETLTTNANGKVSLDVSSLTPGVYTANIAFAGNNNYIKSSTTSKVTINKAATSISAPNVSVAYKDSTGELVATLTNAYDKPLSVNVNVKFNGENYVLKTDSKGKISIPTGNLTPGTYVATISYAGNSNYNSSKATAKVVVKKANTVISAKDVTVGYKDVDGKVVATIKNVYGNTLGVNVNVNLNGQKYTVKANSKGQIIIQTGNLPLGTHVATISYNGNVNYNPSSTKVNILVKKNTIISPSSVSVAYKDTTGQVVATLKDVNGKVISDNVNVKINGQNYKVKANSNGQIIIQTENLTPKTYNAVISYAGNANYNPSSATAKVVVNKAATSISAPNVSLVYKGGDGVLVATITNAYGKPISVNLNVKFNGENYVLKSNSKGKISMPVGNLTPGTYNAVISYAGNGNYKSSSATAKVVVKKANTVISAKDVTVVYQDLNGKLVATIKNAYGNTLGVDVNVNLNGQTYTVKANSKGQIIIQTGNLPVGTHVATISYTGNANYNPSSTKANIVVKKDDTSIACGYFVFGGDMKKVNLNTLANEGVTVLFLNYYAVEKHGQSDVEAWIASANKLGIKVHIWMQTFYEDGKWVNPIVSGSVNTEFFNHKIAEAQSYAKIKGVSGILLDYLRYPEKAYNTAGGTSAISNFTKLITNEIHKINSALIVSAALMPETTTAAHDYGQDYSAISSYVNVVIPMVYKGNYGKSTSWIKTTTKWYVDNTKGAIVWAALQSYGSDSNTTKLSAASLKTDIENAIDGGSNGVIIFRYGLTNFVNFTKIVDSSSSSGGPTSVSINDILTGAETLKTYYSKNNKFPNTVTVAGHAFTLPEFLYLMNQAIYQLGNSNTAAIKCIYGVKAPSSPSGDAIDTQLSKADYLAVAKSVVSYIKTNNQAPNYASSTAGKIMYSDLLDMSSRILAFYKNNDKYMPNYVTINTAGGSSSTVGPTSISIKNILTGANNLKTYYENKGALPKSVTAANHVFTLPEFLYLMSQAIYELGNSNATSVKCIYGVKEASSPSGDSIDAQLLKSDYLTLAKNLASYIKTNNQAPNYSSSAVGKISYTILADSFSRILVFYKNNDNYLPNYVTIVQGTGSSSSSYTVGGMNVKNTITNLDPYYQATTNCQVNNSAIKALVTSLISGLKTDKEKATVIYNYVRDKISYSFYYDTKHGAVGTLNAKSGNCVDQAHLLIAMYRTAGLAARYEQGTCYFTLSGSTYGHVWTQVLIDNVWVVGDPTSTRNSFGVVKNWNTNSYTHKAYYSSLPF